MYQAYLKGKSRCSVCYESKLEDSGLFEVIVKSPFLCKKCNLKIKHDVSRDSEFRIETFFEYKDEFRLALLQYKESNDKFLAPIFLHPMYMDFSIRFHGYIFVCVPSRKESSVKRGFQHLELILETYGFETVSVLKNKSEVDQTQSEKRELIRNHIYIENYELIKGKKVVLFDDVITSGSTIKACYDLLRPHCKKIKVIVLSNTKK